MADKEPLLTKENTRFIAKKPSVSFKPPPLITSSSRMLRNHSCRTKRYLHQVHYDGEKDNVLAFSGWKHPSTEQEPYMQEEEILKETTNMLNEYLKNGQERGYKWFPDEKAQNRRVVFIDIKIKNLSEIDTNQQQFRVRFHYYLTWLATQEEYKDYQKWDQTQVARQQEVRGSTTDVNYETSDNDWTPKWVPSIEFVNTIEDSLPTQMSPFKMKRGTNKTYKAPINTEEEDKKEEEKKEEEKKEEEKKEEKKEEKEETVKIFPEQKYGTWGKLPFMYKDEKLAWDILPEQLGFDPTLGYWIRVQYGADVVFAEELELESFPFDCQDFTMILKLSDKTVEEADLLPFPRIGEFLILDQQYFTSKEWNLENILTEFFYSDPKESKGMYMYPVLAVRIKAARVWASYSTEFGITFCMSVLGLGTFALSLDQSDLGNRLSYCVVFLLADVGTLQLVGQGLPKVPYMTILDQYTIFCFLFLFQVTVWSCVAGAVPDLANLDTIVFWLAFAWFLAMQFFFVGKSWSSRRSEREKLTKTYEQLKRKENEKKSMFLFIVCSCGPNSYYQVEMG